MRWSGAAETAGDVMQWVIVGMTLAALVAIIYEFISNDNK